MPARYGQALAYAFATLLPAPTDRPPASRLARRHPANSRGGRAEGQTRPNAEDCSRVRPPQGRELAPSPLARPAVLDPTRRRGQGAWHGLKASRGGPGPRGRGGAHKLRPPTMCYRLLGAGLIVSTTWVFGRAFAVLTFVNRPVTALRPIFIWHSSQGGGRATPRAKPRGHSVLLRNQDRPRPEPIGPCMENLAGPGVDPCGPKDQTVSRRNMDAALHGRHLRKLAGRENP